MHLVIVRKIGNYFQKRGTVMMCRCRGNLKGNAFLTRGWSTTCDVCFEKIELGDAYIIEKDDPETAVYCLSCVEIDDIPVRRESCRSEGAARC